MKKFLVTGGAGFIGSHFIEALLKDENQVICLDDFNDFYNPQLKEKNIDGFRDNEKFTLVRGDIRDSKLVEELLTRERPEVIVHLAARAGVRPSIREPKLYEEVNVAGTLNLLEASRLVGVKKFIFGSSSSVYGVNSKMPFSEGDSLLNSVSPYSATKIAGEALCNCYAHLYGFPIVSLRFFTVYGPRQRPDLAIRNFSQLMLQGKEITLFGKGDTARDYTFVEDIVCGILSAVNYQPKKHEIFNLGNSEPIKLIELVEMLEDVLGVKAKIKWEDEQPGDVPITYADLDKSGDLLGYKPQTTIKNGLKIFVEWIVNRKDYTQEQSND